jgi:hypothetical protein
VNFQNVLTVVLPHFQPAMELFMLMAGAIVGYRAPDIDLAPVLLIRHRSAFTHGPLFAWAALWAAAQFADYRLVAIGFLAGLMIHLIKDAAPRQWGGSAMINLSPIPVSLPWWLSGIYISAGALSAAYAFGLLVKGQ